MVVYSVRREHSQNHWSSQRGRDWKRSGHRPCWARRVATGRTGSGWFPTDNKKIVNITGFSSFFVEGNERKGENTRTFFSRRVGRREKKRIGGLAVEPSTKVTEGTGWYIWAQFQLGFYFYINTINPLHGYILYIYIIYLFLDSIHIS